MDAEEGDHDLRCSICLDLFYEPLTLQCGHSFCRVCLLQSTKLAPDGRSCPQCRTVIANITDPLQHPANEAISAKVEASISPDELPAFVEQRKALSEGSLEVLAKQSAGSIPVFIMRGASDTSPGAPISLHLFEDRYKILIRRAWEGERKFLWVDATPQPPQPLSGLLVNVESARFLADGRANVTGRGMQRVSLPRGWLEEGTSGLWYASHHAPPSASVRGAASPSAVPMAMLAQSLQAAIARGAPTYNCGEVRACAELYLSTARCVLADPALRALAQAQIALDELQRASARAEVLLAGAAERRSTPAARRDVDSAAWALRHAFDRILDGLGDEAMPVSGTVTSNAIGGVMELPSVRGMAAASPAAFPLIRASPTDAELPELPVFYFGGLTLRVGARASFSLFERRYLILAEECWAGVRELICASVSGGSPRSGQSAVVARMEACTRLQSRDGERVRASLVGVRNVTLRAVREDAEKAGLWYAQVTAARHTESSGAGAEADSGGKASACCAIS